jgi:CRP-like cAMP-binding protein/di/tricarboxylate transporter
MSESVTYEYADLLSRNALFRGLDRVTLAKLAAHIEPIRMSVGQTLFRQGDPPDGLYLIQSGRLGVYGRTASGTQEVQLATCGPGEAVGEIALLSGEERTATVRAESDGELLRVDKGHFNDLVRVDPSVGRAISNKLIAHLRAAESTLATDTPGRVVQHPEPVPTVVLSKTPAPVSKPVETTRAVWRPSRSNSGVGLAALLLLGGWLVPTPFGLSAEAWHALVTLVAVLPLFVTSALPDGAIALTLIGVWVLGGIAPAPVALAGFASGPWVTVLSVSAIGAAIASTGLLYRAALWLAAHARGGFPGQVLGVGLAGLGFGQAIPDTQGRVTLLAPAALEMSEALGYTPGSRAAAGLAMSVLVGFGQMVAPFITSSNTALIAFSLLPESTRSELNWLTWAVRAMPLHIILFTGLMLGVVAFYRPSSGHRSADRSRVLAVQRALLGKPTRQEQVAGGVVLFVLIGLVTGSVHGISPTWICVAGFVLLALGGVLTAQTLRTVNWSFLLLFGTFISMSSVFTAVGLDQWLERVMAGSLAGFANSPALFVVALTLFCFGLNTVLRLMVAAPLVIVALAPVAASMGISPWVVAIVALTACNGFLLPHQSNSYLALYNGTGGRLFSHAQARPLAVLYMVLVVAGLLACTPIWHAMGLL